MHIQPSMKCNKLIMYRKFTQRGDQWPTLMALTSLAYTHSPMTLTLPRFTGIWSNVGISFYSVFFTTVNLWKYSRQQSSVKCEPNIRGKQTVEDITITVGFQLHRKITVRVLLDFHIPDSPRQSAKLQVWPMSRERTSSASKRSPWLSVRCNANFHRHNFHGNQNPFLQTRHQKPPLLLWRRQQLLRLGTCLAMSSSRSKMLRSSRLQYVMTFPQEKTTQSHQI